MHKDVKSWDYFDKTVQIDGKVFDVLVNVRDNGNDQFVYNVALRANNKLRANGWLLDHEGLASGAVGSTRGSISNLSAEGQGGVRESRRVVLPPDTPGNRLIDKKLGKDEKFKEKFIDRYATVETAQDENLRCQGAGFIFAAIPPRFGKISAARCGCGDLGGAHTSRGC